ncbi:MAG: peptidase T [Lachnospiraceae bacterium]|nr:peptidase T [Lachnospiraceae bacterium]
MSNLNEFKEQVKERFIRYARIDSQSIAGIAKVPSTDKQFDTANELKNEMLAMGIADAYVDEHAVVYGSIPSNLEGGKGIAIGFNGHHDTTPDVTGTNVKPWVLENYQGGDIVLNKEQNIVMEASEYPRLAMYKGQDLILTDGTTLLGGDDKAAVATIMTMAAYYMAHPEVKHGPIRLCFTPDEEVGLCGAEVTDMERWGAEVAYTLDGDGLGDFMYENFNGEEAQFTITGLNVHPGTAKNIMINAIEIGAELIGMLPAFEKPQTTEGREGYFHPFVSEGTVEKTFIRCLIRDHDKERFGMRHNYILMMVEALNKKYGEGTVAVEFVGKYSNMREEIDKQPKLVEYGLQALKDCGIEPKIIAIRGGTDGASFCRKGVPAPNFSAGFENAHSRFEYVSIDAMARNVEVLIRLNELFAQDAQ